MSESSTHALSFLRGGGELGELIRSKDWSATALGPADQWPQSLKTTLGILLNSRYPMFVFWGPERIKIYNDGYRPITGHKHPWALGRPAREVWPEIWADIEPLVDRALGGAPTWSDDLLLFMERHGFPEEVYFTFSYSPIRDESGGIGGMFCACTETTAQVVGERRLRTLRDLAAAPADARTTVTACELSAAVLGANASDVPFAVVYLTDESGASRLVAAAGAEPGEPVAPLELSPGDGVSSTWPLSRVVDTRIAQEVSDLHRRFARVPPGPWPEPPARAMVLPLIDRGLERGMGAIVLGISSRRVFDDDYAGWCDLVAAQVSASITNARAAEEERRRAEALAEIDRAKTAFFSNVSHEFRTPLTLMLGPTEEALASPRRAIDGEALEALYRNELRLLKLVNTLLDFSRIEAGRVNASYEPTDLATCTADLASAFRSAIERAGLRFEVDCPPLPEPAYVDRGMWEKIVLNLLSNALKFTFEGGIRLTLAAGDGRFEVRVSDTGVGIPPGELPKIFDRFHRIEGARARTHEGSGIGLALVQDLVKLHGGTIAVESEMNRGSTFVVSIPAGRAHLPAERLGTPTALTSSRLGAAPYVAEALRWEGSIPVFEAPPTGADDEVPHLRGRVLVADDNADMREYLVRLLEPFWAVETVPDGAQALAVLQQRPPDLLLADIMMPRMDGNELLRRVRADETTRLIPVILVSARAGEESQMEGIGAGADDYVVKPFSARELLARVAAHLERGRLRRALARERARLHSLFEQAPAAIAVFTGPEHRVSFANARYRTLCGRGRQTLLDRPLVDTFPELAGSRFVDVLDRACATGETVRTPEFEMEWPQDAGDPPARAYFDWTCQPLLGADGIVQGTVQFFFDVTDEVTTRLELERARSAAEAAGRAKDEFLAMLGHELRNPLSPILTALQLLRLRGVTGVERERTIIERQVRHMVALVDDLLDVSKIARGTVQLKREPVDLADVVAKAIEMTSPAIDERRHVLTVEMPRGLSVDGDPARLAQVVANLLSNAAKYTDPGGAIGVSGVEEGTDVVLRVRDDGTGIEPEMLPRIFDPFSQERQAMDRSQGGLGLGLAIVRSLVQAHGGTVSASSAGKGRGAELTVRLPRAEQRQEEPGGARAASPAALARGPGLRVLVVDDNADAADMLADLLSALGHVAAVAFDGPHALETARTFRPDVVLLDLGLPVMDGFEVIERLRADPLLAGARVVAISGYGQQPDRERTRAAGFAAHLVKPIDLDALRGWLRTVGGAAESDLSRA
jgi:signal transduction histidine kinase/DNA-binding response OmpR family regulator